MKILATYECEEADVTLDSSNASVQGDIVFINGMLSRVNDSIIKASKVSALSKTRYFTHKILSFDHITNVRGH